MFETFSNIYLQKQVLPEENIQCDAREEYIDPDETEEDPDMEDDPTEQPPAKKQKLEIPSQQSQPVAGEETNNEKSDSISVGKASVRQKSKPLPTYLNSILSDIKDNHWGPHLDDSIRYKYLGERKTQEEWKSDYDKEVDRIMTGMQGLLAFFPPRGKEHMKQQRKIGFETDRL